MAKGMQSSQAVLWQGAVGGGGCPGLEGSQELQGAEFPSQGPKASRARGEGQAPCLATEKRRLGRQDAGLFTVGSPRAIKAPSWDQETIYTSGRKGARGKVLYSSLPRRERGRASWVLRP